MSATSRRAQVLVLAQQREELHAGGQPRQEIVEPRQRLVGIAGAADGLEQRRQQLGEMGAGRGRRGWRHSRHSATCAPSRWPWPARQSPCRQRFERLRIVVAAGEDEVALADAQRLALGEEVGIVADHLIQRRAVTRFERGQIALAHQPRDDRDVLGVSGMTWVCSSRSICSRFSTARRNQ